jgi:hypothetical protein
MAVLSQERCHSPPAVISPKAIRLAPVAVRHSRTHKILLGVLEFRQGSP